jgi:hypothetical protein
MKTLPATLFGKRIHFNTIHCLFVWFKKMSIFVAYFCAWLERRFRCRNVVNTFARVC